METEYDPQKINEFILTKCIIKLNKEKCTLASGRESHCYVNWRDVLNDVYLCSYIAQNIISFTNQQELHIDCFIGVPDGATKLAVLTNYLHATSNPHFNEGSHTLPILRLEKKTHGTEQDKQYVGTPKGNVCIIEDVTTTGESLIRTALEPLLETPNIKVIASLALTNRCELRKDGKSVENFLKETYHIPHYWLSNLPTLLPQVYTQQKEELGQSAKTIAETVKREFQTQGINLKLE